MLEKIKRGATAVKLNTAGFINRFLGVDALARKIGMNYRDIEELKDSIDNKVDKDDFDSQIYNFIEEEAVDSKLDDLENEINGKFECLESNQIEDLKNTLQDIQQELTDYRIEQAKLRRVILMMSKIGALEKEVNEILTGVEELMEDKEFYTQLDILITEMLPGVSNIVLTDYGRLNEICMEITKRKKLYNE